eukprot:CAMPEP_0171379840 /NCGR_PEP_ID=MMETSP0879-20121228/27754_1 /TAXON_ID=67004 /ORGANISM="Thalassiosira weissflogii, Strain CCMP1336" /LENGTH=55 /DNA_ID=CAMNT_0011890745 /DNA_START=193 /DNA_END=357 /DNA_ORIENTATION=+
MSMAISGAAPPLPKGESSSPSVIPSEEVSRDNTNTESLNETVTTADCAPASAADN